MLGLGIPDMQLGAMVVATALLTTVIGLWLMARLMPRQRVVWARLDADGDETAFLFEDERLVDATPDARALLSHGPEQMEPFPRLAAALSSGFPDLRERLAALGREQQIEIASADGRSLLRADWRSGFTRISLLPDPARKEPAAAPDHLSIAAMEDELADLRATVDCAPILVWREDATGAVRWANAAYIELALQVDPEMETLPWPLPRLFADTGRTDDRLTLSLPERDGTRTLLFEASRKPLGDTVMIFAAPADRLAEAEGQHREFIQTLTKTFAHLPIGLALFDRDRRLAVFNPALTDLSGLQPIFLSKRPTLFDFLDALREARRMPEPKDYRGWRRQIAEMEAAAANGTHIETWNLPDGQTFRVTGRPHPDGAIAFLFEDITSEVSLTRRFRSDLELGHSVIDAMDEAIAVFSPTRALLLSNTAYGQLWGGADDHTLGTISLSDAIEQWRAAACPSPVWDEVAAFVSREGHADGWRKEVRLPDGRGLAVRVEALSGNASMVAFRPGTEAAAGLAPVNGPLPGAGEPDRRRASGTAS